MKRFSSKVQLMVWVSLVSLMTALATMTQRASRSADDRDRGDVPGWVMITMMTSIVVIALLVVFQDAVEKAVKDAFAAIVG